MLLSGLIHLLGGGVYSTYMNVKYVFIVNEDMKACYVKQNENDVILVECVY